MFGSYEEGSIGYIAVRLIYLSFVIFFGALFAARLSRKDRSEEITAHLVFKGYKTFHMRHSATVSADMEYEGKTYTASLGALENKLNRPEKFVGINGPTKIIATYSTNTFTKDKEYLRCFRLVNDDVEFKTNGLASVGLE